jgi:membrane protease YdiL (CAAX protease family)
LLQRRQALTKWLVGLCSLAPLLSGFVIYRWQLASALDLAGTSLWLLLVVAPCLEELAFRGLLQDLCLKLTPAPLAYLLVNVIFSALHYHINSQWWFLASVFIAGFSLSLLRSYTKTIIWSIVFHAYYNSCLVITLIICNHLPPSQWHIFS